MAKLCACGTEIKNNRSLCLECGEIYGYDPKDWPEWLRWLVSDIQREHMDDLVHKHLSYEDEIEPNGNGGYRPKREFTLRGCRTETHLYEERGKY